ncbi:hypothetical protein CK224_25930 [Mesorhizobium sp. WSM3862]|nr:hypothetical protein CK224_25930 [Mesorhizobium sp. WSM3862]
MFQRSLRGDPAGPPQESCVFVLLAQVIFRFRDAARFNMHGAFNIGFKGHSGRQVTSGRSAGGALLGLPQRGPHGSQERAEIRRKTQLTVIIRRRTPWLAYITLPIAAAAGLI